MSRLGTFGGSEGAGPGVAGGTGGENTKGLHSGIEERSFGEPFAQQIPLSFMGTFDIDTSLGAGTQTVTGLPFKPRTVIFFSNIPTGPRASWGIDNGTLAMCIVTPDEAATLGDFELESGTQESIAYIESGTQRLLAGISATDFGQFTITKAIVGVPTNTFSVIYGAFR